MKHYTNTNNPVDFPGSDHHSGDGGYSLGSQEKYDEFVKVRNYNIGKQRIRLLAEQAAKEKFGGVFGEMKLTMIFAEKFAELIVRECAGIACEHMELNEGTDYNIGSKIKQHFGVEE